VGSCALCILNGPLGLSLCYFLVARHVLQHLDLIFTQTSALHIDLHQTDLVEWVVVVLVVFVQHQFEILTSHVYVNRFQLTRLVISSSVVVQSKVTQFSKQDFCSSWSNKRR
jgi:hypothetical protein